MGCMRNDRLPMFYGLARMVTSDAVHGKGLALPRNIAPSINEQDVHELNRN